MIDKLIHIIATLKRHLGMSLSVFLHISLFILLLINFPQCQRKRPPEIIISVDLLPIGKVSNVANKQLAKPKPKEEAKPIDKPKSIEEPIPEHTPQEKEKPQDKPKPEPKPEEKPIEKPKEEVKPIDKAKPKEEIKKTEPKPEAKKEDKKKKKAKPKLSEYDKLLKDIQEIEKKTDQAEETLDKPSKGPHDADMPLSLSIKDSIKKQIEQCWSPPAGNKDASKMQVLLEISFKQDGSVANVKLLDSMRYNSDEIYRVAADAAVRAVHKASPLQGLPIDQYSSWQNLEFNFDPSGILGD